MATNKNVANILVAEDEPEIRDYLDLSLRCRGYGVAHAENGDEVLSYLRGNNGAGISLVLLDIMMPYRDGMDTLREIRRFDKNLPIIMLSGVSSPTTIVETMKSGANDFLAKPVGNDQLVEAIQRTLAAHLGTQPALTDGMRPRLVPAHVQSGPSWMDKMETLLRKVGASDAPVLLLGETGVGKEVLARKLHASSPRAARRFLKVNCAALPSELMESELFGYERGAFTGAVKTKPGKFELADGGTILLDEIGDMDFKLQSKLLQVLQDQEFERVGGTETMRVDVRVMAATHTDLEKAIGEGRFREDLFYRLNVINITVPPLRERREEILSLAEYFIRNLGGSPTLASEMTPVLSQALLSYHWPGNVRELENFMRKYLVVQDPMAAAEELQLKSVLRSRSPKAAVPISTGLAASPAVAPTSTLEEVNEGQKRAESEAILAALGRTRWNRKQAAALLSVDYKALLYKMKKLDIDRSPLNAEGAPWPQN